MDQKFYRMFTTSSMQQRIYSNWRQLKFTREAWRCKLLAARHQKTMYRRYVNEDSIFWAVERNAKDVLPGWAMITPFSARTRFTAIGKVDIGLMGVFLVLNSSIVSSANFLVTYRYLSTLNNRKMRDARSFFTEGIIVASWMMIAANPMLAIGILMLLSDRHWQTSFFDYSGGGDKASEPTEKVQEQLKELRKNKDNLTSESNKGLLKSDSTKKSSINTVVMVAIITIAGYILLTETTQGKKILDKLR